MTAWALRLATTDVATDDGPGRVVHDRVRTLTFDELFESELSYVARSLRRLGVPEAEIEDVAQEVFVVIHGRLHEYDPCRPLRPWLFAFAWRAASNHRRSERRRRKREDVAHVFEEVSSPEVPDAELDRREQRALVLAALDRVPFPQRVVLIMNQLDGVPVPAVAEALEVPVNTVYSRLRLGKQAFARAVSELGRVAERSSR